jgi:adenylate cyclase
MKLRVWKRGPKRDALPGKLAATIAAFAALVCGSLAFFAPWQQLERKGFDVLTLATAPNQSQLPITIVGIDEASFAQVQKKWPWATDVHAKLVDSIAKSGALAIVFDVLIAEPGRPEEDAAFADAIKRAGNVILVSERAFQETRYARQWIRVDPLPRFIEAGATPGYGGVTLDRDQVLRNMPAGDDVLWRVIVKRIDELHPGMLPVKEPPPGAMIRYAGPDHTYPYVSYYQALEADKMLPPDAFRDQVVFVGRDIKANINADAGSVDNFGTPFTMRAGWMTPGVEIHANALETALRGDALRSAPPWWSALLAVAVALGCSVAMRRWRPLVNLLPVIVVIGALAGLDWALFTRNNIWLPVGGPALAAILTYVAFGSAAFVTESRRKAEVRRAFSLYVSPEVVDHVLAHPERLKLGGERREVTMLFTDLAGFTTFTEQLGADKVARILNVHFSRATAIVKRHGGTVNRFIGDAIMAMWGAPLEDPEQALHACRAAVEMQEDLEALRAEFRAEGLPEIRMRVGIHSCTAVIGNLGSTDRFDYTAIGDGVNLAARLEGVNKLYGTGILVSGETVQRAGPGIAVRLVDRVIVKGKSEPVDIYTPCADAATVDLSSKAIESYRGRRWDESERLWRQILERHPVDTIAQLYVERIQRCRLVAPATEWDGAVELEKL